MQHSAFNYMLKRAKFLLRLCGFQSCVYTPGEIMLSQMPHRPPNFMSLKKILDHLKFPFGFYLMNGNSLK